MSLYNMMFGTNPLASVVLHLLGKGPGDFGRFRDAYIKGGEEGTEPTLCVFTRCGGGNREDYEGVFEAMRAHPEYVRDFDDDFDSTYATFEFRAPEKFRSVVAIALEVVEAEAPEAQVPPMVKFNSLLRKIQETTRDPAVQDDGQIPADVRHAMDVGQKVFAALGALGVPPQSGGDKPC